MEKEQEREWEEAQKIELSVDLVNAAKKQLEFLAVVDRNRHLYDGLTLQWAIFRYNAFWLPLLAKHSKNPLTEKPLVVPLDCEWIWHCHRLDPERYKLDCEKLFGRILDNDNVISSVQGISINETKEIWNTMYPEESYELKLHKNLSKDIIPRSSHYGTFTSYDLASAVTRKIPFSFQVLKPHMSSNLFLQEAVARYKGFLHLIRTNRRKNIRRACVPTYDIDLIWHSHQLHPVSYCEDLIKIVGEVVGHDDDVSDRTKRSELDNGFSEFTKQWEETFGLRYWKAGAMKRGDAPTPVTHIPFPFNSERKQFEPTSNCEDLTQYPVVKSVEVLLEFVEIKNMPKGDIGNLFVSFSKKQPDKLFNTKRILSIFSESREKHVAYFECEPTGELMFELISHLPSNMPEPNSFKLFGSCSLSLEELFACKLQLSIDKWLLVVPVSGTTSSQPVLHVSVSFTIPTPTDQVYHLVHFPERSKPLHDKSWTHVIDDNGNDVMSLQMRNLSEEITAIGFSKEVHCINDSGETHTLARFVGNEWCMKGTHGSFKLRRCFGNNGDMFELVGDKMVKVFLGRRLDYEAKCYEKQRSEQDFVTVVEFSSQHPYGRAIALIDFKSGTIKVKDKWMILLGITLTFILFDTLIKQEYNAFIGKSNMKDVIDQVTVVARNIESKMEAYEMIKNARCFAEVNTLDGNTKGKKKASEEIIKSARFLTEANCGVIIDSVTKSGWCGVGYGNHFTVKSEANNGDCDGSTCSTGCDGTKCGVPNDYSGGNFGAGSAIKSAWCYACVSKCW